MPNVAGREFPYTPQGKAAAGRYRQSLGMRHGGMMGFRPVGYQKGGGVESDSDIAMMFSALVESEASDLEIRRYISENRAALERMAVAGEGPRGRGTIRRLLNLYEEGTGIPQGTPRSEADRARDEEGKRWPDAPTFDYLEKEEYDPSLMPLREPGTGIPQKMYRPGLGDDVRQFLPPESAPSYPSPGLQEGLPEFYEQQLPPPELPPLPPDPWGYNNPRQINPRNDPNILKIANGGYVGRGMRNGGMMGFRPVGYQAGDLVESPINPLVATGMGRRMASEMLQDPGPAGPAGPITPLVATGMGRRMAEGAPGGDGGISKAVDAVSSLVQEFMAQGVPDIAKKVTNAAVATFGLPVDLVNSILESLGFPVSDTPIGGSRNLMETFGFPGEQEAVPASGYTTPRSDRFGQIEIPGAAGTRSFSIDPLVSAGAGARFAEDRSYNVDNIMQPGTGIPQSIPPGRRHGGIMSLRRR